MGNDCLTESLAVLDGLGDRSVFPSDDENPSQGGVAPARCSPAK